MSDTFPRQHARTQRFTLGDVRNVTVSPDGSRVVFIRSRGGEDPVNCLWVLDVPTGEERLVADPVALLSGDDGDLPAEELARRERMREAAGGVTSYATDAAVSVVSFALAGRLFVAGLISGRARELAVIGPVFDPRPDPTARRVAYVSGTTLRVAELDGTSRAVAAEDTPEVTWGSAEFIAAEEMGRYRGYWWSPDGSALAVARVDNSVVDQWHIADPASPWSAPHEVRYPAAGTTNASVTLHVVRLDGDVTPIEWDHTALPYLVDVRWSSSAGLVITVQSRDQRELQVMSVDPSTGATTSSWCDRDDAWVEIVPGAPAFTEDGSMVVCADRDGARRLMVGGQPVTPPDLQVRAISATDQGVWFLANPIDDATVQHVWHWTRDGGATAVTTAAGVHTVSVGGSVAVVRSAMLDAPGAVTQVQVDGTPTYTIQTFGATPLVAPRVALHRCGTRSLATAVLLPRDHDGSPLPVLMDPYGGPHALRVVQSFNAHLTSQWFADQGFAVVVVDGRGTPGRGSAWERSVLHDLAHPVLDDQVDALQSLAGQYPLDLSRVAIRGWSFGGYLAALAVLERPDVFHAAVAGAPVTEWRLYDTHYTERYLGDPMSDPAPYDTSSLLPLASRLTRPLLLVHGLADDNVVAAHTLQLSSALLSAGRPHEVLPLVGVTHMTPQEVVAENLLLHQLEFLRRSLGLPTTK